MLSSYCTLCHKMESINTKMIMKGQDSRELVDEAMKKKRKNINNYRCLTSLIHVYLVVFMNDFGLDRKVFYRR